MNFYTIKVIEKKSLFSKQMDKRKFPLKVKQVKEKKMENDFCDGKKQSFFH